MGKLQGLIEGYTLPRIIIRYALGLLLLLNLLDDLNVIHVELIQENVLSRFIQFKNGVISLYI